MGWRDKSADIERAGQRDRADLMRRVGHDFTLHPPENEAVALLMDNVRAMFKTLAEDMAHILPMCREQSMCITKLEEACFNAIAAIARNQEETP